jgi:gamma-glutamyltranspeptidase / glutathione hydrolase
MTPTILTQGGRVAVVIGTEGGPSIATQVFQVLVAWHDFRMSLGSAVAAPRVHHQLLPAETLIEEPYAALEPSVRAALSARGYRFVNRGWNGDVEAIVVDDGKEVAVSDPRGRGVARVLSSPR